MKSKRDLKDLHTFMSKVLFQKVKEASLKDETSMSHIVRDALRKWLKERERGGQ